MDKHQLERLRKEFFFQLDKKPSHGAPQIKQLYIIALNNVLLDNTEYDKVDGSATRA
jgi:hypothetical protein